MDVVRYSNYAVHFDHMMCSRYAIYSDYMKYIAVVRHIPAMQYSTTEYVFVLYPNKLHVVIALGYSANLVPTQYNYVIDSN